MSDRLTHVEARLDGMDRRFDEIDQRFDGIDKRLDAVEMRVASLEKQVEGQGKRIESIEKRMEESITSFRNEMRSEFATVHGEIRHLQQITDMRERLASVEAKLATQHG